MSVKLAIPFGMFTLAAIVISLTVLGPLSGTTDSSPLSSFLCHYDQNFHQDYIPQQYFFRYFKALTVAFK